MSNAPTPSQKNEKLRCFSTWQMVEEHPPQIIAKIVLRELMLYVIFACFVAYMAISVTTPTMFYHYEYFRKLFVASPFESVEGPEISFMDINTIPNVWNYLRYIEQNGFSWDDWSNDENNKINKSLVYDNKLLGVPRLRQLKVKKDSCSIPYHFKNTLEECFDKFSRKAEDDKAFGPSENYKYTKEASSVTYVGDISTYHGAGFITDLKNPGIVETLQNHMWISRGTRVVFFEFTVYNPNVNLFFIAKMVFECPATGGVIPSYFFRSVKLIRYLNLTDYVFLASQSIVVFFLIFYTLASAREIAYFGIFFFHRYWNWITILMLLFGYLGCIFDIFSWFIFEEIKTRVYLTSSYVNLEYPTSLNITRDCFFGLFIFLVYIKLFKYLAISRTMGQLNSTFSKCRSDIQSFSVLFLLILSAFSITGYLFFGRTVYEFSGIGIAMFTLLRAVLGDFDYDKIKEANSLLAPIFFLSFIFIVFFILLNMFLAIINDAYADVKSEISDSPDDAHLAHFVGNEFRKIFGRSPKSTAERELTPHQKTIAEIRAALQKCGFKDPEIDMFFARYNIDPTATVGSFDANKILAELEGKPQETKSKSNAGKTVTKEDMQRQQLKLKDIEHGISTLTSKVDTLLKKLDSLENVKKRKK